MKNKIEMLYNNFKFIANTPKYKATMLLSLILALYSVISLGFNLSYLKGLASILFDNNFLIIMLFILLANTLNTYQTFDEKDFLKIRYKTKYKYLQELIKQTIFNNIITFILINVLVLLFLNIFKSSDFGIYKIASYGILNITYIIYTYIKIGIIISLLSTFAVFLYQMFNKIIALSISSITILSILVIEYFIPSKTIDSLLNIPLFIIAYLSPSKYSSFMFEINSFLFFLIINIIIIIITFKLVIKYKKD